MSIKTYLTVKQVMEKLQISRATAYKLISSRRLKSFKIGHLVRIRECDLKNFIEGKPSKKNKK
jgi:excisionase family DNA binding protein